MTTEDFRAILERIELLARRLDELRAHVANLHARAVVLEEWRMRTVSPSIDPILLDLIEENAP